MKLLSLHTHIQVPGGQEEVVSAPGRDGCGRRREEAEEASPQPVPPLHGIRLVFPDSLILPLCSLHNYYYSCFLPFAKRNWTINCKLLLSFSHFQSVSGILEEAVVEPLLLSLSSQKLRPPGGSRPWLRLLEPILPLNCHPGMGGSPGSTTSPEFEVSQDCVTWCLACSAEAPVILYISLPVMSCHIIYN